MCTVGQCCKQKRRVVILRELVCSFDLPACFGASHGLASVWLEKRDSRYNATSGLHHVTPHAATCERRLDAGVEHGVLSPFDGESPMKTPDGKRPVGSPKCFNFTSGKRLSAFDGAIERLQPFAALDSGDNACHLFAREHDEPTAHGRLRIQLQMMFSTPSSLLRAPRRAWRWQSRSDDGCLRAGRPSRSRDRSRTARDARDAAPSSR